jgi:signal transduction histidine kinase/CheY-like chemotaxis protein
MTATQQEADLARALDAEREARRQAEAAMRREAALAEASALLVGSQADPFPRILQILGEVEEVDRAYLFMIRDNGTRMDNTAEWCAPGIEPQIQKLQDLETSVFSWWIGELAAGRAIQVRSLGELPPAAAAEREILEMQGVQSVLAVPMIDNRGRLVGFMGFDRVRQEGAWSEAALRAIRIVAEMSTRERVRQRMLEALNRSQERYRLAGLATHDLLYDWDIRRGITTAGEGGWAALGFSSPSGNPLPLDWWESRIHPADRTRVLASLEEARKGTGTEWEASYRWRRGDDTGWARVFERGYFVRDSGGEAVRMVGVMSDRTEEDRMQEELRHAQKMQAVGALAGGVAHEFNNLLAVVLGYGDLLARDPALPFHLREAALEIRDAAERGSLLTAQLLAFGRKQVARPRPVRLAVALLRVHRLLARVLPETLHLPPPRVTGDPVVSADPAQLDQLFLNLALNARDAMPDGGEFHLEAAPGPQADTVEIRVRDTGTGMSAEVARRVFEPFFTTKPAGEGTGLGLSTVYGIVQGLGGSIEVDSVPGQGTTFRLTLPILADEVEELDDPGDPDASTAKDALPPGGGAAGSLNRVLVVEDDAGVASLCRRILERSGYRVHMAGSGEEALGQVEAMTPEERAGLRFLLCDVGLPGGPGTRLAEALRTGFPELAGLPAVFMSGYTASAATLAEAGAVVLPKPFSQETLLEAVTRALAPGG